MAWFMNIQGLRIFSSSQNPNSDICISKGKNRRGGSFTGVHNRSHEYARQNRIRSIFLSWIELTSGGTTLTNGILGITAENYHYM